MSSFSVSHLPDNYVINTQPRLEFQNKSFFYRQAHLGEQRAVEDEFFSKILSVFDKRFNINDLNSTARIWDFVLKGHEIKWCKGDELTVGLFKKIDASFQQALSYTGPGIASSSHVDPVIDSMCDFLLAKEGGLPDSFLEWENLKKVIFVQDPEFLQQFRSALQQRLQTGFASFQEGKVSEAVFKGFVYNVIALLPYAYPRANEGRIEIPTQISGEWKFVPYHVDKKFSLSPSWLSSSLPIYGLLSDVIGAPPLISCLGTTYPAGDGFFATLASDFTPGFSVGEAASWYGDKEIKEWLEVHNNAVVTGMSLGGALSFHLSRMHPDLIADVWAFNPAGLYPWNWWGVDHSHVNYHIYYNENDLVSTMGIFPEGDNVEVYRVLVGESENFLAAHAKAYCAAARVTLIRSSASYENRRWERIVLTTLHFLFSSLVFVVLLSIQLIIRVFECFYRVLGSRDSNVVVNEVIN